MSGAPRAGSEAQALRNRCAQTIRMTIGADE
jgi:hypothetical protein